MVLSLLYLFFIYPIEIFIETVFSVSIKLFSDPGIAIIFVSLCVQFLVLPLYKRADAIYTSPSGLVFYWTLNNLFSLAKKGDIVLTDYPEYDLEAMEKRMYAFHDYVRDPSNWTVLFSE